MCQNIDESYSHKANLSNNTKPSQKIYILYDSFGKIKVTYIIWGSSLQSRTKNKARKSITRKNTWGTSGFRVMFFEFLCMRTTWLFFITINWAVYLHFMQIFIFFLYFIIINWKKDWGACVSQSLKQPILLIINFFLVYIQVS